MLVARKIMPWYDERFRGYGWDKVHHGPCLWSPGALSAGNRSFTVRTFAADTHTLLHRDTTKRDRWCNPVAKLSVKASWLLSSARCPELKQGSNAGLFQWCVFLI